MLINKGGKAYDAAAEAALNVIEVTIANGESLSGEVELGGRVVGIITPGAWTAADLTFQASDTSGGTFNDVYISTADTEYTVQAGASRHITIPATDLAGMRFLKVRSGTSGTPVNQAAARTIKLVVQP